MIDMPAGGIEQGIKEANIFMSCRKADIKEESTFVFRPIARIYTSN
jgi:hypothetical protein